MLSFSFWRNSFLAAANLTLSSCRTLEEIGRPSGGDVMQEWAGLWTGSAAVHKAMTKPLCAVAEAVTARRRPVTVADDW
jgi:hypothetical protein